MSSKSNSLPHNATSTNGRHAVIAKLRRVIDMLERASSIENITGFDHPDESVKAHIQRLEDKTFNYLRMCYFNLEHFLLKNTRHHEETIRQKMIINPSFLAPSTITNYPYTPCSIVPMKVFCKDYITQTAFIPAVLEICLEHHFYPYSECGGLLTSFSVYTFNRYSHFHKCEWFVKAELADAPCPPQKRHPPPFNTPHTTTNFTNDCNEH